MSSRTLILLPNNLGDVIMATPVLEGLKAQDPTGHIAFLVEEGFDGGLVNNPHCDCIIRFPRRVIRAALRTGDGGEGLRLLGEAVRELSSHGYSRIVNLCQHSYIPYLVTLIEANVKIGRQFLREGNHALPDAWSQYLYAIPFARRFNNLHAVDVYRRIAGAGSHRGGYTIRLTSDEVDAARGFFGARLGRAADRSRTIVLQPGAAYASKRWPAEHFVALGRMLVDAGWQIVITGAPAERELAASIGRELGDRAIVAAGETTFRQSIAIVSQATGCVTGDTALMHAAAALDVKTFAIFGPTSPVETGPYGDGHRVFSGACTKKPCFGFECADCSCMKTVSPQTVFECIVKGSATDAGCDVYRTALKPGGDYALLPATSTTFSYIDESGAARTRAALGDPATTRFTRDHVNITESREVARVIDSMHAALLRFLRARDVGDIKEFERIKHTLDRFTGIGAFWTAMLNLRLNSVPVLDPIAGVRGSAEVCARTAREVRSGE